MRLLFIHADRIAYEVNEKTAIAEPLKKEEMRDEMKNCLVVFSCVEKFDGITPEKSVENALNEIENATKNLGTKNVMLFPFAHLSENLSSPKVALDILKKVEKGLKKANFKVKRAAFGWNKKFTLESKGHPMAVLSRHVCPMLDKCTRCPYCERLMTKK